MTYENMKELKNSIVVQTWQQRSIKCKITKSKSAMSSNST